MKSNICLVCFIFLTFEPLLAQPQKKKTKKKKTKKKNKKKKKTFSFLGIWEREPTVYSNSLIRLIRILAWAYTIFRHCLAYRWKANSLIRLQSRCTQYYQNIDRLLTLSQSKVAAWMLWEDSNARVHESSSIVGVSFRSYVEPPLLLGRYHAMMKFYSRWSNIS